jgi:hypothetical protein
MQQKHSLLSSLLYQPKRNRHLPVALFDFPDIALLV